jgi:hypothetical protein
MARNYTDRYCYSRKANIFQVSGNTVRFTEVVRAVSVGISDWRRTAVATWNRSGSTTNRKYHDQ